MGVSLQASQVQAFDPGMRSYLDKKKTSSLKPGKIIQLRVLQNRALIKAFS